MRVTREHRYLESEARWSKGHLQFCREQGSGGRCVSLNRSVRQTAAAVAAPPPLDKQWMSLGRKLARRFDRVRLSITHHERRVNRRVSRTRAVYLEVSDGKENWTFATPLYASALSLVEAWVSDLNIFLALPLATQAIAAKAILFSSSSFGHLLHEIIGHRLESDDFSKPIDWKKWSAVDFDIWDTAGETNWLGHTPFDDAGTAASAVKLLCGQTGAQQMLTAQTGNARASAFDRHPLIRQRCLDVRSRVLIDSPSTSLVVIDEVSAGSFDGETAELFTCRQRWIDQSGREFRLPALKITAQPHLVMHMKPCSLSQISHLPGGCLKESQNVMVSFHAPSAWCSSKAPLRIAVC